MKLIIKTIILVVTSTFFSCSMFQSFHPASEEYMPLSVGNKWFYKYENSSISEIKEVTSIDTIEGKVYFQITDSHIQSDTTLVYHYHQRLSNDTLFTLNFDNRRKRYFERVDAIFSLNENDNALFSIQRDDSSDKNGDDIHRLPSRYTISVRNKKNDLIEFIHNSGLFVDGGYTTIYQRGIGMIKFSNDWGVRFEIEKYELNNY